MGIGASAGSLQALDRFLDELPADSGMTLVVVQHLERSHPSALAELLGKHTEMPVQQAEDGVRPRPNHVYIIPPNAVLTLERGLLRVARPAETGLRTPIDAFFRSLAQDRGENAVGIIVSGAGTDGTAGLRAIKESGGLTLAQAPETATYDSMPQSAIAAGLVDFTLPVEEMPARLQAYAASRRGRPARPRLPRSHRHRSAVPARTAGTNGPRQPDQRGHRRPGDRQPWHHLRDPAAAHRA